MLEFRINYTFNPDKKENGIPNTLTLSENEPPINYMTKYYLVDRKDVHYKINSFEHINFPDPFPKELTFKSKCHPP
jgi:hypothetical protein